MAVIIEKMVPQDLPQVLKIEEQSFSTPWTAYHFIVDLTAPGGYYLSAKQDSKIVGYAGLRQVLDEGHITILAVDPAYRGQGIAKQLVKELLQGGAQQGIKVYFLEVRASNSAAQKVYQDHGFKITGRRKDYYPQPEEDAILMERRDVTS